MLQTKLIEQLVVQLKKKKKEFGRPSYLIYKIQFQMDLNMVSILTGLDEKKKDYSDTEVEISFFQGNVEVLTKRDKN